MNAGRKLLVAMMLGVTAAISGNDPIWSSFNSSFPRGNDRLLEPIIIPNLTAHTQAPFSSTSRTIQTQQIKNNTEARGYFLGKIYYPDESVSQESKIDVKFTDESKADDSSLKFSSRYSSKPESSEESKESSEDSEERSIRMDNVGPATFEQDKILSGNDAIPGKEKHKSFSDYSENPDPTYLDAGEDDKADIRRYSGANGPKETEELDVSPATNEPYQALQRPTSFRNSHYPDEESESYETSSEVSREIENPTEEKNTEESGPKDYGSLQTPLEDIKFRGPHSVKDDFESERSIARLSPIRRHQISHNWPYSKAQLKEAEELNEISDETVESEEGTRISGVSRVDDEAELRQNKKPNHRDRNKHNGLGKLEEKDQDGLLYQVIKPYRAEPHKKQPRVQPTLNYAPKPGPKITQDLWSGASPTKATVYDELFSRHSKKVKPSKFNITKELESNFPAHKFLGPVVFKQNIEQTKTKPSVKPHVKKEASQELEKKEAIDHLNLRDQKIQKTILSGADSQIPSQTFDHQEESDEMYNQILANIQSVFGIRTQPLKSSQKNKEQELVVEENRALTWALPLRKRENAKPDTLGKSSDGQSESKVKSGRSSDKSIFLGQS